MDHRVKITFGMIVLNGEPFTAYNLRSLYPFAHEIIVVEGACRAAKNIASEDGHSKDETLSVIRRFQAEEDPDNKVILITAEDAGYPDGFWEEKTEMSQAYAQRATGNYLWQVDCDEFYLPQDIERMTSILRDRPDITMVSFAALTFWGAIDYITDSFYLRNELPEIHRIFAWDSSYQYVTHRPPTVYDAEGRDLKTLKHMTAGETARLGIMMYHYSLLLPKQVIEKCEYYSRADWNKQGEEANRWARECFFALQRPFRVHSVYSSLSWLERFTGPHPPQVEAMVRAIASGQHKDISLRNNADVEKLLSSGLYALGKLSLRLSVRPARALRDADRALRSVMMKTPVWPVLRMARRAIKGRADV